MPEVETPRGTSPAETFDPMAMMKAMMEKMEDGASHMEACPMASMFKGKMKGLGAGPFVVLLLLGLALIAGGVFIFIESKVLVWLLAGTSIALGVVILFAAFGLWRWAAGLRGPVEEVA